MRVVPDRGAARVVVIAVYVVVALVVLLFIFDRIGRLLPANF